MTKKSKARYEKIYIHFKTWLNSNNLPPTEENLICYFIKRGESIKGNSYWMEYSILKSTLKTFDGVDISSFEKLLQFVRSKASSVPIQKTSEIFSRQDIIKFLKDAPDNEYLMTKVVIIFGIAGALRCTDFHTLSLGDIEDRGEVFIVRIARTRRKFTIVDATDNEVQLLSIIRKYIHLRPPNSTLKRFFFVYRHGQGINQPAGIHTFGSVPNKIATYLKLPNPHSYTGVAFRKTAVAWKKWLIFQLRGDGRFGCTGCSSSYKNKRHLYRHHKYECGKAANFFCKYCNAGFKRKETWKKHENMCKNAVKYFEANKLKSLR